MLVMPRSSVNLPAIRSRLREQMPPMSLASASLMRTMLLLRKCLWVCRWFPLIREIRYVSDAKVKREPAKYAAEAAAAESSDVLGKREYISIASSADKAAVLG